MKSKTKIFFWVLDVPIRIFPIKIAAPNTRKMLIILDPIIFPIAKPTSPPAEDIEETAISGREVPKDITVNPIINGDNLNISDNFTESFTKIWVASKSITTPKKNLTK